MAKQKTAEVDEDVIRGMVKGDIPRMTHESQPEDPAPSSETVPPAEPTGGPSIEAAKPRRRKEPKDYAAVFLKKRESAQKRQTYVSAAHFAKITDILAVVASGVSVPVFLDNLLSDHLEQYRDEINALYSDKFKTPL